MLTEYPYGSIRNTGALHVLVAMGLFGANGHAYLKIHNTLGIVNFLKFLPINWNVHTYFFAPLFAVGVYITILGSVGGAAGSRSYNKAVVNNFKMFYLVVNAMSAFLISWFAAIDIYCIFLMNGSTLDLFGIRINIYASFGLMLFELLLAIFSILLCCLSGYPDGTRKNETIPLSAIIHQPPVQIPPHNQGYAYDPNMATGYANNGWTR